MTGSAVVLGASIAGLLAARVLSGHYRVTIVERDDVTGADQRRGVPQARHLHGLMERGRQILEELHPGITAQLAAEGAPTTEVLRESRWYLSGLRMHPTDTGLITLLASRPMLEDGLRRRTLALENVTLVRHNATGLVGDENGDVVGVRCDDGRSLAADLVVDATGRGSRASDWLVDLGHHRPAEQRVDVDLGYASRFYRRRPDHLDGDRGVVVSTMPGFRGGGAIVLEGERWHVTLAGMLGDHPPADHEGFTAFAATLPVPDVHRIVADAEPLGDAVPHRFRGSLRRRHDLVPASPNGFLVVGDALCSFNPLYAQGMTVAGQQALVLRDLLAEGRLTPQRFYRRSARAVDTAWRMSTGADLRDERVEGPRPLRTRLTNAYVGRVHVAAHRDPEVARVLMRTANLTIPPTALLAPPVLLRVLRRGSASPGGVGVVDGA
ncbi:FAD-dependent oxidoreductase [Actinosynnema sp. NPDC020468]|uniref:FAD-dependent oxidoreductase n=1 Tax=Actinosynnema sp. NPDC020468 TaxID=3154488 RepID=UPI003411E0FC